MTRALLPIVALGLCSAARAEPPGAHLTWFAGGDYLGSAQANGGAFSAGLRLGVLEHFAAGVDLGYGLLQAQGQMEDRWWLMPTAALVLTSGRFVIDLGGGAGIGTVSGYVDWPAYFAKPFTPVWHITAPAVRGHLTVSTPLRPGLDGFGRAEVATVLSQSPGTPERAWAGVCFGLQGKIF